MAQAELLNALEAYQRGTLSLAALARAVVGHPSWHLPTRAASSDDTAAVALVPGPGGQWWLCAFTSAGALESFRATRRDSVPGGVTVFSGARLAEHLPLAAQGVGIDPGSAHAVTLGPPAPALLREMGEAVQVEAVLAGRSDEPDQFDRLRRYRGYRVAWQGSSLVLAPDSRGRRLVAVFTSEDTLAAYAERHGPPSPPAQKVDGTSLFELLRRAPVDGIVFNCAGPIPPKAVAQAFSAAVLAGVDSPAQAPPPRSAGPAPEAEGAAAAPGLAAGLVREVSSYRPRLVRQDEAELSRGIVSKPLVSPSEPTQPIVSPMICLVCETESGPVYATAKTLGTHRLDDLVTTGARQLWSSVPPRIDRIGTSPGVLCCLGPHAAECLLVPEHVEAMQQKLGVTEMLAALPMRGVVVACGMNDPLGLVRLSAMVKRAYQAAGAQGLYDELVLLVRGHIVGRASVEVERKHGSPPPDAAPPESPVAAPITQAPALPSPAPAPAAAPQPGGDALRARSLAECGLYLDLADCPLAGRRETIADAGPDVRVSYRCTRPDGREACFEFLVRKSDMAATSGEGPIRYGHDATASAIIDAGQYFGLAEGFAKAAPGSLDRLGKSDGLAALEIIERAAACMDEVTKFIPQGQEMVPESAFFTPAGRAVRNAQPAGRWSRPRLGAIGGAYRQIANRFRAHAHEEGWLYG
jgi:hypothetical protein